MLISSIPISTSIVHPQLYLMFAFIIAMVALAILVIAYGQDIIDKMRKQ
jgi:hypothetical protein